MDNRVVIERYFAAFARADRRAIAAAFTDDAEWIIPGHLHLVGQAVRDAHRPAREFTGDPVVTLTRIVTTGNVVTAEGDVLHIRPDGSRYRVAFCDIFDLRDGRIARMTSYLVDISHVDIRPPEVPE